MVKEFKKCKYSYTVCRFYLETCKYVEEYERYVKIFVSSCDNLGKRYKSDVYNFKRDFLIPYSCSVKR